MLVDIVVGRQARNEFQERDVAENRPCASGQSGSGVLPGCWA